MIVTDVDSNRQSNSLLIHSLLPRTYSGSPALKGCANHYASVVGTPTVTQVALRERCLTTEAYSPVITPCYTLFDLQICFNNNYQGYIRSLDFETDLSVLLFLALPIADGPIIEVGLLTNKNDALRKTFLLAFFRVFFSTKMLLKNPQRIIIFKCLWIFC